MILCYTEEDVTFVTSFWLSEVKNFDTEKSLLVTVHCGPPR